MIDIDGSRGEGGGQILRTSLALSMLTGKAFAMRNIRAGRAKPGLRRQHVACVEAAAQLCGATVHGASVSSKYLEFTPGPISARELAIDIGSAGAASLVVQTILVPALVAGHPLRATIKGGTHNPMAPPFEFLDRVFLPHLRAMGAAVTLTLDRYGFAPGDARATEHGQLTLTVDTSVLRPIELVEVGEVRARRVTVLSSRLPTHVAERELKVVRERLPGQLEVDVRDVRAPAIGNVLMIELERAGGVELITSFGAKGKRAELVAEEACTNACAFLDANVPVGEHLADQLLLPMAIAGGGRYRCAPLSLHATTNIVTIQQFLDLPIEVATHRDAVLVSVGSATLSA
ncbi:MAG: RNA 3'-terminal phosphate cyclase [Kofleriaceae bacterium]|nr:RNA 3'-terminal phosphate cyclase [Kofleriaceae bacterium]